MDLKEVFTIITFNFNTIKVRVKKGKLVNKGPSFLSLNDPVAS